MEIQTNISREIKFRAWDGRNKEIVYSNKEDCFYVNTKGVQFMYAIPNSNPTEYHRDYNVMQYTGIDDDNGKDIYEGDIVEEEQVSGFTSVFVVEWIKGQCAWNLDKNDGAYYQKVIGNIHENKDLL